MEITLNLTQQQIDFLKEFAMNHYPDAPDNLLTDRPCTVFRQKQLNTCLLRTVVIITFMST